MAMASTGPSFRYNNGPQIYSHPDSQNLREGICRCDFVKDLERGRLSWIIQMGPMQAQGSLQKRGRRVRVREGNVKWKLE